MFSNRKEGEYEEDAIGDIEGWTEFPDLFLTGIVEQQLFHIAGTTPPPIRSQSCHKRHGTVSFLPARTPSSTQSLISTKCSQIRDSQTRQRLPSPAIYNKVTKSAEMLLPKMNSKLSKPPINPIYSDSNIKQRNSSRSVTDIRIKPKPVYTTPADLSKSNEQWSFESETHHYASNNTTTSYMKYPATAQKLLAPPPSRQGGDANQNRYSSIYGELLTLNEQPSTSRSLNQWRAERMNASIQIRQLCKMLPPPRAINVRHTRRNVSTPSPHYVADPVISRPDIAYKLPLVTYELRKLNVRRWNRIPDSVCMPDISSRSSRGS